MKTHMILLSIASLALTSPAMAQTSTAWTVSATVSSHTPPPPPPHPPQGGGHPTYGGPATHPAPAPSQPPCSLRSPPPPPPQPLGRWVYQTRQHWVPGYWSGSYDYWGYYRPFWVPGTYQTFGQWVWVH